MMKPLSPFTQLVILLTGRWAVNGSQPLSNAELVELRRCIGATQEGALALLEGSFDLSQISLDSARIRGLLNRGLGVFQSVDRWRAAGIWVVSWADPEYPVRIKQLKQRAPMLLFGYGNPNAFGERSLAIVGSRNASDARLNQAAEIGRACSERGITVVSGGARGVDSYAMSAGIVGTGKVVGVLADSLLKESGKKQYRDAIREGRLALMSEVHPEARFDVGNAMARNRLAYACAAAALIVECEAGKGGTWAGALEALQEGKTVYVLNDAIAERELAEKGAIRVDMPFALGADRLVNSERPAVSVPPTSKLHETVLNYIGNPLRSRDELVAQISTDPTEFIDRLVEAAVADGLVEQASDQPVAKKGAKRIGGSKKKRVDGGLLQDQQGQLID